MWRQHNSPTLLVLGLGDANWFRNVSFGQGGGILQTMFGENLSCSDEGNGDSPMVRTPSFYGAAHAIRSLLRFGSWTEEADEWFGKEIAQGQTEMTYLGLENTGVEYPIDTADEVDDDDDFQSSPTASG